ncbi:hypothetical protein Q8A67_004339 [Cirrhinus molitorella]|uniref:Uncharacterized protein n=1 Tax=Cirrhinus molitorella TaxID=172907 RepID=A0AA88Q9F4_9TELE|nr:hypothetical protein Q8A67_004339 [Cirrhinus molitorella]
MRLEYSITISDGYYVVSDGVAVLLTAFNEAVVRVLEAGGGVLLYEISSGSVVQSWRPGRRWIAALPANNRRQNRLVATSAAVLGVTFAEYHLTAHLRSYPVIRSISSALKVGLQQYGGARGAALGGGPEAWGP